MYDNHLAIANIPIQKWGELYSDEEALNIGTIFHDLNKPFFASEAEMASKSPIASAGNIGKAQKDVEREQLMTKINQISFFLDDLNLYLDTHEKDAQAIKLYHQRMKELIELKKQFAKEFYPLTKQCIAECDETETSFCGQDGPIPWEGACV
ncbi:MAG: hypothetical protein K0R00_759 [Herbinix sp.]|jgi:hypothetical protein|nr:hypothetical protein [Herbinix sp.]